MSNKKTSDLFHSDKQEISVFFDDDEDSKVKKFDPVKERDKASLLYKKNLITEYNKLKREIDLYVIPNLRFWVIEKNKSINKNNVFYLSSEGIHYSICSGNLESNFEVKNFDQSLLLERELTREDIFRINRKEFKRLPEAFSELTKRIENFRDVKTCLIWSSFEFKSIDSFSESEDILDLQGVNWMEYNFSLQDSCEKFIDHYDFMKELIELMA